MDKPPAQEPLFPETPSLAPPPVLPVDAPPAPVSPAPAPAPAPARPGVVRFLSPVLAILAAVLTLAGTFLPLFEFRQPVGSNFEPSEEVTIVSVTSAWQTTLSFPGQVADSRPSAPIGAPLLFAIAILLAAAVASVIHVSGQSQGKLARWMTSIGAAFLLGTVFTIGMDAMTWEVTNRPAEISTSLDFGIWLLFLAVPFAVGAVVVAYLSRTQDVPVWADPALAFADTPTPPSGIPVQSEDVAITVLPPEPPPTDLWAADRDHG